MKNQTLVLFLIFLVMAEQKPVTNSGGLRMGSGAKREWPEVVGLTAEEAKAKIKEGAPGLNVQVVHPDNFVTMDFNPGRVRIFMDATGKVRKPPTVG